MKVMQAKGTDNRNSKLDAVVEAMISMNMKSREKGSISLAQKHNSLRGQWFGSTSEVTLLDKNEEVRIERGSIIKQGNSEELFMVCAVYQDNGNLGR